MLLPLVTKITKKYYHYENYTIIYTRDGVLMYSLTASK